MSKPEIKSKQMMEKENDYMNQYSRFLKVPQNMGSKIYEEEIGNRIKYGRTQHKIDIRPHVFFGTMKFEIILLIFGFGFAIGNFFET